MTMATARATFKDEYGQEHQVKTNNLASKKAAQELLDKVAEKCDGLECLQLVSVSNLAFSRGWLKLHLEKALQDAQEG